MGKMFNALLIVIAIEIAFALFPAAEYSSSSLITFLLNPTSWDSSSWLSYLLNSVTALGAAAIIVGTIFSKQDWIWRAGLIGTFLTFGAVIVQLWLFVNAHLTYIGVEAARALIVSMLISPVLLYFIMVSLDFISGKD